MGFYAEHLDDGGVKRRKLANVIPSVKPSRAIFLGGAVSRPDHGTRFCYPKVAKAACSTSLHLSTISARLRKNVPEERRAQGTGKPWVGCPHCTTKVCYVCRFCQLASHIYASKQSGLASDGSSDCVLAVCLVVHLLFLGPFRPGIPLPSPQCVCAEIGWAKKILIKLVHHQKDACH